MLFVEAFGDSQNYLPTVTDDYAGNAKKLLPEPSDRVPAIYRLAAIRFEPSDGGWPVAVAAPSVQGTARHWRIVSPATRNVRQTNA